MRKLPLGITSFEDIRKDYYIYVDKTEYIYKLVSEGKYYFLSRPRRFGKTLLVDTLRRLFEGRKDLFEGLWIYDKWDWEKKYPVIRIDFSIGNIDSVDHLKSVIDDIIITHQKKFQIDFERIDHIGINFKNLIVETSKKFDSKVVILVDEYDKPILDNITNRELAKKIRDTLADFYGVIKGLDEYLRFVFLTGVSKFSKVNLFSKLNNLTDITVRKKYSAICGYREEDLDSYFGEFLQGVDRGKIRRWYNGYSWLGEKVYNPYDILLFIDNDFRFQNYWFSTGNPTFLIELFKEKKYFIPNLEDLEVSDLILDSFDIDSITVEALLWQTGYLTIKEQIDNDGFLYYRLGYPNLEVEMALNQVLLSSYTEIEETLKINLSNRSYKAFKEGNIEEVIAVFKQLLASIPYTAFTKNEIEKYEGYYLSVLYSFLAGRGLDIRAEDVTNRGRIDISVVVGDKVYILELKMSNINEDPLEQIKKNKYWEKYQGSYKDIYIVGIVIDGEKRNIVVYKWEKITT